MPRRHALAARFPHSLVGGFVVALVLAGALLAGCDAAGEEESGTAFIEGEVIDATGGPVPGATVRLSPGGATTETDSSGFYSLAVALDSTSELTLTAEADGFPTRSTTVTGRPGETELVPAIELFSAEEGLPTTVTGTVETVEGTPPPQNARVIVTDGALGSEVYTAPVDPDDGSYRLTPRVAGSTELTLEARSDAFTAQRIVTVFPDETREDVDFMLGTGTFTVEGAVTNSAGDALGDIRVEVLANEQTVGGESFTARTDADGTYSIDVEVSSSTELTVTAEIDDLTAEQVVTAFPGETREDVDLVLAGGTATVVGSVADSDGNAIENARVEATATGETFATQTGSGGEYTLDVQLTGSTELTVRATSNDRTTEQVVTVVPGERRQGVNLVLGSSTGEGTATVEGRVTDSGGTPIEDARVEVPADDQTIGAQPFATLTDADGTYRLAVDLRSSTEVEVRAQRDDQSATRTVTVIPGETREGVDFTLGGSVEDTGTATVTGRVTSSEGNPLDARVAAQPNAQTVSDQPVTTRTEGDGTYTLDVEISASTDLVVRATNDDREDERIVTVFPDETRENVNFTLAPSGDDGGGGGDGNDEAGRPAYIELQSVVPQTIQVQETGGAEVSRLTFVVRDSAGQAISLDQQRTVRFSFGSRPPSGDIEDEEDDLQLLPEAVPTNDNGEATVNLNSGIVAGVAQVVAELDGPNGTIESEPVPVTIHGGFPSRERFTVSVEQFNYAGLSVAGLENTVSVLVGDQYSNPVKPETAIYFNTDAGVVEGDVLTDAQGRGNVQLISGNPQPDDGIALVTARTVNVDNEEIQRQAAVVVSGVPILEVTSSDGVPGEAELGRSYTLEVVDQNGNPLAPGTTIQVRAEGNEVEIGGGDATAGDVDITLENTPLVDQNGDGDALDYEDVQRGFGRTRFRFKPIEDPNPEEEGEPTLAGISIIVTGPGGSASCSIDTSPQQTTCSTGTVSSAGGARLVMQGEAPRR